MATIASTEEKVLGKMDLTSIAIGNVIGGGIMSVVGVAIGLTGRSVAIAMVICAIMTLISILPNMLVSSTIRMNGGMYTLSALLGGKTFAGVYTAFWLTNFFGASLYCTAFAQYMLGLVSGLNFKFVAIALLFIIALINFLGIKIAAGVQKAMVVVLVAALLIFSFFGFRHVQPGFFQPPDFMRNGWRGIMYAAALMNFACGGAGMVINFGRQCKNPTKDIPFAIITSSIVIMIIYAMVSVVAAGVLPISEVEGQSLAKVAVTVLPSWLYIFFIIGGAIFALVTSLNALMGWLPPPVVQACNDGWLPKRFGAINKKYHSPHWVLLFITLMAGIILITGWDIESIAIVGTFLANVGNIIIIITLLRMPKVVPQLWEKSIFHMSNWLYNLICIAGAVVCLVFEYFLFDILNTPQKICIIIYAVLAVIYAIVMSKRKGGKQIQIETSYEAA
ncbi:MAG: APC family permease [Firmicutes bacterium]|nr:APC family permease [Bacillota bacterium]